MGIAPFRLALDDVVGTIDGQQIAGAGLGHLRSPNLVQGGFRVNPGVAEADDLVGTCGDHTDVLSNTHVRGVKGVDAKLGKGDVERFLMPGTNAINFLLHDVLGGGGVASIRNDPQAKGYSQLLLFAMIPVPRSLAENLPCGKAA